MSVRLRESGDAVSLSNDNLAELMKLSGEVASLRARERESDWAATNAKTLQENEALGSRENEALGSRLDIQHFIS